MSEQQERGEGFQTEFKTLAGELRKQIKILAGKVKAAKIHPALDPHPHEDGPDTNEMAANITLAYRHLEDAGMRLGKAIQAYDGGVSVYDREQA